MQESKEELEKKYAASFIEYHPRRTKFVRDFPFKKEIQGLKRKIKNKQGKK